MVTLFLTMLVGAGGNAGNQSAILIIRGLATGEFDATLPDLGRALRGQTAVALILATASALGGFVRVLVTSGTTTSDAAAISAALFAIVMSSVVIGTTLPFGLARIGADPAHAGTSIQVVMDVLGVAVTCVVCHFVLDVLQSSLVV